MMGLYVNVSNSNSMLLIGSRESLSSFDICYNTLKPNFMFASPKPALHDYILSQILIPISCH